MAARGEYERPWRRIAADLRAKILAGRWQVGDRLPTLRQLQDEYDVSRGTVTGAIRLLADEGLVFSRAGSGVYVRDTTMPEAATAPEHQPVVAAIVTSHLGVLAGKRNDNKPPWTFIAGEVEPGESIADAAEREVKEETGLEVRAGHHEIGRRVHPKTRRTMIYLACLPVATTDVFVGDPVELADVQWLSLADADQLLPGMFAPVREHLGRMSR